MRAGGVRRDSEEVFSKIQYAFFPWHAVSDSGEGTDLRAMRDIPVIVAHERVLV